MLRRILTSVTTRNPFIQANAVRLKSTEDDEGPKEPKAPPPPPTEEQVYIALKKSFPKATYINVTDESGGCGAMFKISIEAYEFEGKSFVEQHRMVNESVRFYVDGMHAIRIHTEVPPEY